MNSIQVVQKMISELSLQKSTFTVFEHSVGKNWRQKHNTVLSKVKHLQEALVQRKPLKKFTYLGEEIISESFKPEKLISEKNHVVSISSKLKDQHGKCKHLPMMNLHPHDKLDLSEIREMIEQITGNMSGYLLDSGRHYHFYGITLLNYMEWRKFMSQFLMPTVIVSPRYIGHCFYRDYAALRLSTDEEYKPTLPYVVALTGALRD